MLSTEQLTQIAQWLGISMVAFGALTGLAFVLKWGIRFRLVGVTSFTGVLAAGVFALSLSLYQRPTIPGAVQFVRVFDRSGGDLVITVPATITPSALEATLQQAAQDLFSPGRTSPDGMMTIRARTILHPQEGISQPLYLGAIRRSLARRNDENAQVSIDTDSLATLAKLREESAA